MDQDHLEQIPEKRMENQPPWVPISPLPVEPRIIQHSEGDASGPLPRARNSVVVQSRIAARRARRTVRRGL